MEIGRKIIRLAGTFAILGFVVLLGLLRGAEAQGAALLEIRAKEAETIPEESVEKMKSLSRIVQVERVLWIRTKPYDVVGVEPGAPLRIVTGDNRVIPAKSMAGRATFKAGDDRVSIVGKVYREDYERGGKPDPLHGMGGMLHPFEIGSSFTFPEAKERIRVIGIISATPEAEARKVFLPLATAQRIFGKKDHLTHLFVTVGAPEYAEAVAAEIKTLSGGAVEVIRR